jgi:hypothetical protein
MCRMGMHKKRSLKRVSADRQAEPKGSGSSLARRERRETLGPERRRTNFQRAEAERWYLRYGDSVFRPVGAQVSRFLAEHHRLLGATGCLQPVP